MDKLNRYHPYDLDTLNSANTPELLFQYFSHSFELDIGGWLPCSAGVLFYVARIKLVAQTAMGLPPW